MFFVEMGNSNTVTLQSDINSSTKQLNIVCMSLCFLLLLLLSCHDHVFLIKHLPALKKAERNLADSRHCFLASIIRTVHRKDDRARARLKVIRHLQLARRIAMVNLYRYLHRVFAIIK